jgi:hypothetical protein
VIGLASFRGLLFAGSSNSGVGAGTTRSRSLAGVWSEVDTTGGRLKVFGSRLYKTHFVGTGANLVRSTANGTTWVAEATLGSTNNPGYFEIFGLRLFYMSAVLFEHSLNGTTWTSTNPTGMGNNSEAGPMMTLAG